MWAGNKMRRSGNLLMTTSENMQNMNIHWQKIIEKEMFEILKKKKKRIIVTMEIEVLFEHDRHEVSWACIP